MYPTGPHRDKYRPTSVQTTCNFIIYVMKCKELVPTK